MLAWRTPWTKEPGGLQYAGSLLEDEGNQVYPNSSSIQGPASVPAPVFSPGAHPSHQPLDSLVPGED